MNFAFQERFDDLTGFETCCHLRDFADELGVDTDIIAMGLADDLEQEQLTAIAQDLKEAIEQRIQAEQLAKLPDCPIGPYANGICTICGGREP